MTGMPATNKQVYQHAVAPPFQPNKKKGDEPMSDREKGNPNVGSAPVVGLEVPGDELCLKANY